MKDILVPIDKAGRLVLPKFVREELAIHPGDKLKISIQGTEVTLRPAQNVTGFVRKGRALVFSCGEGELLNREDVEAVFVENRDERTACVMPSLASRKRKQ